MDLGGGGRSSTGHIFSSFFSILFSNFFKICSKHKKNHPFYVQPMAADDIFSYFFKWPPLPKIPRSTPVYIPYYQSSQLLSQLFHVFCEVGGFISWKYSHVSLQLKRGFKMGLSLATFHFKVYSGQKVLIIKNLLAVFWAISFKI